MSVRRQHYSASSTHLSQKRSMGLFGGSKADHAFDRINQFFYGGCSHSSFHGDIDRTKITDTWYLDLLPWFHRHHLNIESFDREGDQVTITMEGNSHMVLDWEKRVTGSCLTASK